MGNSILCAILFMQDHTLCTWIRKMLQLHTFLPLPEQDQKPHGHTACIYNSGKGCGFLKSYGFPPYQKPGIFEILPTLLKVG